jgi:diguanylate cyclase (GGDEF)-like protein
MIQFRQPAGGSTLQSKREAPDPLAAAGRAAPASFEHEELRGVSRTVAEIHWLLLILVLVYLVFGGPPGENEPAISTALFLYAALVTGFRYGSFFMRETRWKISIETWAMLTFVTWVLWFTGKLSSPLLNAYLLGIVTAALALGKRAAMVQVGAIALCYLVLSERPEDFLSLPFIGTFAAQFAPVVLVAYTTATFSADIRYGLARAKMLAETDGLTGLFNPRGFAIAANRLFAQAVRYGRPASLLMIDSDNLKRVNDTYGHEAGNTLLRQLAHAIQAEMRYTDVLARYGGDEFIVLLPETPPKGALDVAERVREAVAALAVDVEGARVSTSVSIGMASFPEDGGSLDALALHADRALYEAKQSGRNRVVRFGPEPRVPLDAVGTQASP